MKEQWQKFRKPILFGVAVWYAIFTFAGNMALYPETKRIYLDPISPIVKAHLLGKESRKNRLGAKAIIDSDYNGKITENEVITAYKKVKIPAKTLLEKNSWRENYFKNYHSTLKDRIEKGIPIKNKDVKILLAQIKSDNLDKFEKSIKLDDLVRMADYDNNGLSYEEAISAILTNDYVKKIGRDEYIDKIMKLPIFSK